MAASEDSLEEGGEETFKEDVEKRLQNQYQEKATQKYAFTRVKTNCLTWLTKKSFKVKGSRRRNGQTRNGISDMNDRLQVFLNGRKDELSSLATDVSLNIHRRHVEKNIEKKSKLIAKDEIKSQE